MPTDYPSNAQTPRSQDSILVRQLGDEFEQNWKSGSRPELEDFLKNVRVELQAPLFRELLSRQLRLGDQSVDLRNLLRRFPEYESIVSEVFYETRGGGSDTKIVDPINTTTRYTDVRLYRRGGMADLYLARDLDLGRDAVIKQLRDEFRSSNEYSTQLEIEAEITGQLEHPGVVPIFSIGRWGEFPFYAMRVIQGTDLLAPIAELHANGGLNLRSHAKRDQLFSLLEQICSACNTLAYAHNKGVVHCDIKPLNIMIGKYGETYIIDWGLARTFNQRGSSSNLDYERWRTHVASAKEVRGFTPGYVSPEQHLPGATLTPASDIYSMGATLYHVLTNQTQLEGSEPDFAERLATGRITPARKINPKIPRPLEAICKKAMAVSPNARYATAKALASDLQNWMRDEEVSAMRDGWSDRIFRGARRHRIATMVILLASIALLGLGVFSVSLRQHALVAELLRGKAESRLREALDTFEHLSMPLEQGDKSRLDIFQPMAQDLKDFANRFLADAATLGSSSVQLARAWELRATANGVLDPDLDIQMKDLEQAEQQYRQALKEPTVELSGKDENASMRLAVNLLTQGRLYVRRENFAASKRVLDESLKLIKELQHANQHFDTAQRLTKFEANVNHELGRYYHGVANSTGRRADYDDAENHFKKGLNLRTGLSEQGVGRFERAFLDRDLARSFGFLGDLHLEIGKVELANQDYQKSLELRETLYKNNPRDPETRFQYCRGLTNFAQTELVQKLDLPDAIEKLKKAMAIQRELIGEFRDDLEFATDLTWACLSMAELEMLATASSDTAITDDQMKKIHGFAQDAELHLSDKRFKSKEHSVMRLKAQADLLQAESTTNSNEAKKLAAEAEVRFKELSHEESRPDDCFRLAVCLAILDQSDAAIKQLKIAVKNGNINVEQFQAHRKFGLKSLSDPPADRKMVDELIEEMKKRIR